MLTQPLGERFVPPIDRTAVGTAAFASKTILVALKNPREAEQLTMLYRRLGWNVVITAQRRQFVELIETEFFDLIVTDRFRNVLAVRSVRRDGRRLPLHFVASDAKHAKALFEAGAAAIMVRTIRHDDFFSYDVVTPGD